MSASFWATARFIGALSTGIGVPFVGLAEDSLDGQNPIVERIAALRKVNFITVIPFLPETCRVRAAPKAIRRVLDIERVTAKLACDDSAGVGAEWSPIVSEKAVTPFLPTPLLEKGAEEPLHHGAVTHNDRNRLRRGGADKTALPFLRARRALYYNHLGRRCRIPIVANVGFRGSSQFLAVSENRIEILVGVDGKLAVVTGQAIAGKIDLP